MVPVEPEMLPLSFRFIPPFCHWRVNGNVLETATPNVAVLPVMTVWLAGAGGNITVKLARLLVTLPEALVMTAE